MIFVSDREHAYGPRGLVKKNSVAFSPRANYTDWATATCRQNLVPTFVDRGVSCGQRGGSPTVVNLVDWYGDSFTFLYVDDARTSQETHLWSIKTSYGHNFTFLYLDYAHTSQETHLYKFSTSYGDSFTFLLRYRAVFFFVWLVPPPPLQLSNLIHCKCWRLSLPWEVSSRHSIPDSGCTRQRSLPPRSIPVQQLSYQ
jgi:hypothetical protein